MIRWCCVILCVALGLAGTLVPTLNAQGNQGSLNRKIDKEQIDLQQLRQEIRDAKRKKDMTQPPAAGLSAVGPGLRRVSSFARTL